MKVGLTAIIVGLTALFSVGCGSASSCSEVCQKAKTCGALPGNLGTDVASCGAACNQASARTQEPTRACIDYEGCSHITLGACGSW